MKSINIVGRTLLCWLVIIGVAVLSCGTILAAAPPARPMLFLEDSDNARIQTVYLSTDGEETQYSDLKAVVTRPDALQDTPIVWESSNAAVATIEKTDHYEPGSTNTIKALAEGEATITVSCAGESTSVKVIVKSVENIMARMRELSKVLPVEEKDFSSADFENAREFYSFGCTIGSKQCKVLRKETPELNAQLGFGLWYDFPEFIQLYSSSYPDSGSMYGANSGKDYTSAQKCLQEMKKDYDYYPSSAQNSLNTLQTKVEAMAAMIAKDASKAEFKTALTELNTRTQALVVELIDALPGVDSLTLADEEGVIIARNAYTALIRANRSDFNGTKLKKLADAEKKIAELKQVVDPDSVTVTPSEATLKVSGRTTLVASVSPENASDQTIVWTSGDEAVASVNDMGIVTANAVGKTTITAETVNGKTANCIITVEEGMIPVTGITINEQDQSLVMGKSLQLTATVSPQDATNQMVEWRSGDTAIAMVDANGRVTGVNTGTTTITAASGDIVGTTVVTVDARPAVQTPQVYFQYKNGEIQEVGEDGQFVLEQSDQGRFVLEGSQATPYWKNTVDPTSGTSTFNIFAGTGEVMLNKTGTATGWVIDEGTLYGEETHIVDFQVKIIPSTIDVLYAYVDGVEMGKTPLALTGSETKTIVVKGRRANSQLLVDVPFYAITCTSDSSNVNFGTSTKNTAFNLSGSGSAKITVSLLNTAVKKQFDVEAAYINVTDMVVTTQDTYFIDDWNPNGNEYTGIYNSGIGQRYDVQVKPDNATNRGVTWTSYDPEIAYFKVEHVNGFLPVKAGTGHFTVTSNANPAVKKDVVIRFEYKNKATAVAVDQSEINLVISEGTKTLPITFSPANSTEQRMDWTYSEAGIVQVQSGIEATNAYKKTNHTITPLKEGTVTVTGTPWDTTGGAQPVSFTVTVTGQAVEVDVDALVKAGIESGQSYLSGEAIGKNAYGNEWNIFALARSGVTVSEENIQAYIKSASGKVAEASFGKKSTDISRVILAMESIGYDASDVRGVNLYDKLYNYSDQLATMGSNDVAFALIALDAKGTIVPEGANWSRNRLLETLLTYQDEVGGGFTLGGTGSGSPDMTAMCLTALAPYNDEAHPAVQTAVTKALDYLKTTMDNAAGYGNSNSDAQIITALSALKLDIAKADHGFTVAGANPITSLERYRIESGGFKYLLTDQRPNEMATQQATYALEAYRRIKAGSVNLYDLSDVQRRQPAMDEAVQAVIAKIDALPEAADLQLTDETALAEAKAAFDALTTAQKALVDDAHQTKLSADVTKMAELKAAAELAQAKTDAQTALAGYKDQADYRAAEQKEMAEIITAGNTAIDVAANKTDIAAALKDAQQKLDALKTDAQYRAEEAKALADAKTAAIADLTGYKKLADYREAQQAELTAAITAGTNAINTAADQAGVTQALTDAKTALDAIKTNAQLTEEERQQAMADAKAAMETAKAKGLTQADVDAARAAIDKLDAATQAEMKADLDSFNTVVEKAEAERHQPTLADGTKVTADGLTLDYKLVLDTADTGSAAIAQEANTGMDVVLPLAIHVEDLKGNTVDQPITITISADLSAYGDNPTVKIAHIKDGKLLENLAGTYNGAKKTVTFKVSSFSDFILLAQKAGSTEPVNPTPGTPGTDNGNSGSIGATGNTKTGITGDTSTVTGTVIALVLLAATGAVIIIARRKHV